MSSLNSASRRGVRVVVAAALAGAGLAVGGGCGAFRSEPDPGATPVPASAFYQPSTQQAPQPLAQTPAPELTPPQTPAQTSAQTPPPTPAPVQVEVQASVQAQAAPVAQVPAAPAAEAPVVTKVAVPMGTYLTVGGVLAEVNGVPIFAARVMKELDSTLAARAKETDPRAFEMEARTYIGRTVSEFISEELEYASAQRNLEADDKKLADAITTDFRQKLITAAGGSLEQAKRIAAESGDNFDDLLKQRSKLNLIQIYYFKKVLPRIEITTNDMRRYYSENVDRLFTERTEASFRLIRIDPNRSGGKAPALEKIKDIRDRAASGEDFAALAGTVNDDSMLLRGKGMVGPISRNSLAMEKVEEAVFRTDAGQLTEIIEDRGGFYIAKVEMRKAGTVRLFEEQAVQEKVREELRKMQLAQLREQVRADLRQNAIIRQDPRMIDTALEMAVQRYPIWREQGAREVK